MLKSTEQKIRAYHFTGDKLRNGDPIPPLGEPLVHKGDIVPCKSGLHASIHPLDALEFAPGLILHLVDLEGEIVQHDDKLVGRKRTIIATVDVTELLREFARWCALSVIHLWDAPDIVRQYLETGDEKLRYAARDAAWDAARDAARQKQRDKLKEMVEAAFSRPLRRS